MKVIEAMKKYKKTDARTRIYVRELENEICRNIKLYYNSEVLDIYDHNGDMVCEVEKAQ